MNTMWNLINTFRMDVPTPGDPKPAFTTAQRFWTLMHLFRTF